jgi:acetyl-CoA C-acetyltransferase
MQDAYAIQSNERGIAARDSGAFAWEIVPVISCFFYKVSNCSIICFPNDLCSIIQIEVPVGRGKPPVLVDKDESLDKVKYFTLAKIVQISYTP